MKKLFLLVPVAALALTACTSESNEFVGDKQQQAQQIAFTPLASSLTRSAASGAKTAALGFPDQTIYAAAYQAAPNKKDYFGETAFNKNAADKWSAPKYWPLATATLNFLAVTEGPTGTTRVWGGGSSDYASQVVVTMVDNSTTQHDLMYAYQRASVTQTGTDGVLNFPDVAMEFNHALAWVNFTVKANDEATAGAGIVLKNITLNGAKYAGEYTVTLANFDETDNGTKALSPTCSWSTTAWTSASAANKNVLDSDGSIAVNNYSSATPVENAGDTKGILVAPNPNKTASVLDPSFDNITVKYTFNGDTYTYTYAPTAANRILEPGKKYVYNIIFKLHEILIVPTVVDWTPETGRDVTIQD